MRPLQRGARGQSTAIPKLVCVAFATSLAPGLCLVLIFRGWVDLRDLHDTPTGTRTRVTGMTGTLPTELWASSMDIVTIGKVI